PVVGNAVHDGELGAAGARAQAVVEVQTQIDHPWHGIVLLRCFGVLFSGSIISWLRGWSLCQLSLQISRYCRTSICPPSLPVNPPSARACVPLTKTWSIPVA